MATVTTFPGTTLIPEWKLGWIGKKVSPSVVCLAQNIPALANVRQDLSIPDNLLYIYNCNEKYLIHLFTCNCCQKHYVGQKKTDPSCPTKRQDYWIDTLKTKAPMGLNFDFDHSFWAYCLVFLYSATRFGRLCFRT